MMGWCHHTPTLLPAAGPRRVFLNRSAPAPGLKANIPFTAVQAFLLLRPCVGPLCNAFTLPFLPDHSLPSAGATVFPQTPNPPSSFTPCSQSHFHLGIIVFISYHLSRREACPRPRGTCIMALSAGAAGPALKAAPAKRMRTRPGRDRRSLPGFTTFTSRQRLSEAGPRPRHSVQNAGAQPRSKSGG